MHPSYFGKIPLRWCDSCHTPVLSGHCACGAPTRGVPVTPPGDARPAFPSDIVLINRIYRESYGVPLISAKELTLLNKVPDRDRMEEIIVGGAVVGSIRFISGEERWEPIPRPEAAGLMSPEQGYVVVDAGAVPSIQGEGASVLAPGLIEIDPFVRKGDEVFVLDNDRRCIGVGRAKVDASEAEGMERGVIVRTRKNVRSVLVRGEAGWEDAVRANSRVIEQTEASAVNFVRQVAERYQIPSTVSYSGGKDSLATLLVVMKAIGKVPLLFADTGLEFPETYENVDRVTALYDLEVIRASGESAFWERFSREGPPAVDARWCCRVCKLTPVREAIRQELGRCLSFIGQRKYESFRRMQSQRVWKNPHVPNQVSAAPIQHWTALHVWLYLFRESAPYNVLYEQGLDRIGCFMCPSSDIAVLRRIQARYPALWKGWQSRLNEWSTIHNLPPEWITQEQWRVRGSCTDETDSDC
ncbi:MAG: phosphoadenosine phosphosulfate reductase family protein, partial [Methanoregulaceae archaeon]|nr:phosphoadenosine phosphosulfate reductase family protein [Methanoregulaceae archaeon]